jgi:hypothetical protein
MENHWVNENEITIFTGMGAASFPTSAERSSCLPHREGSFEPTDLDQE